uniref:Uncharacterized protein n=1 Tax=Proboscia inermis TaxID=420281 RepID=A0A7S0C626_9STRA|mmetsp:Transcript_29484/g.29883  ORF Transcript_29484/g.29883 Transcript_29484/m.29883 type:complete len:121 (+) Transcript_29484:534-896(+)
MEWDSLSFSSYVLSNPSMCLHLQWSPHRPAVFFVVFEDNLVTFDLVQDSICPTHSETFLLGRGDDCLSISPSGAPAPFAVVIDKMSGNIVLRKFHERFLYPPGLSHVEEAEELKDVLFLI